MWKWAIKQSAILLLAACGVAPAVPPANPTALPVAETAISDLSVAAESTMSVAPLSQTPAELAASLDGLDFDTFLEQSFRELMLREPEYMLETGLDKVYGVTDVRLTDISDAYLRETQQFVRTIRQVLNSYDPQGLTPEQQLSYDIYAWYLDDLARGAPFLDYSYPVTFMLNSRHAQTRMFFTDIHPLATRQDAEAYVTRLAMLGAKIDQMVEALELREQAGVVPPALVLDWTTPEIARIAGGPATVTPYFLRLEGEIEGIEGLSEADRSELLAAADLAIGRQVIPAYGRLWQALRRQQETAPSEDGLWQYQDGEAFYNYLLRHETTTELGADEIHHMGLQELERIHGEMRAIFAELGYPEQVGLPDLYAQAAQESGLISGSEAVTYIEALLREAEQGLGSAFDIFPSAELAVIGGPSGNFYVAGTFDGTRPGAFYANTASRQPRYGIPTTTYHEGVPGHHFQLSIQGEADLPTVRKLAPFNAYIEGWALYSEQLAFELGWYEDDPYGDLGRLQLQAMRAARLVVDTGIHAQGWDFDRAVEFMVDNTGMQVGAVQGEVGRYIAWPGQATSYMVGMLEIMALRQEAQQRLGNRFDLVEFHHVVLSNGSMPLDVLREVVEDYIVSKSQSG